MINNNTLVLIPTPYSRDRIFNEYNNNDILETTNIKTIYYLYRTLLSVCEISIESKIIGVYETTYILKEACKLYLSENKNIKFKNIITKNEFVNELYIFYEEISLVYSIKPQKEINELLDSDISRLYIEIIGYYKNLMHSNNMIDENMFYNILIEKLSKGDNIFSEKLFYKNIILHGFDIINMRYSILLDAIGRGYNINIEHVLPYSKDILRHFESSYNTEYVDTSIFNFNIKSQNTNNNEIMKSIFVDYDTDKKLDYENIYFMAGFGSSNEIKNVCSYVYSLIKDKKVPSYSICIMFDNSECYHTRVIDMCSKMNIDFVERRGEPLWNIPIIVILASLFSVIKINKDTTVDVDINRLANILSSPYISLENIDYRYIRKIIYDKSALHLYPSMDYQKLHARLAYKSKDNDEHEKISESLINFLDKIYALMSLKSFKDIGKNYLELLEYVNIDKTIEINNNSDDDDIIDSTYKKNIYQRDNIALALFIKKINELSFDDDIISVSERGSIKLNFFAMLNEMMRKEYIPIYHKNERGITISTLYDTRYHDYEYIFIFGFDNSFLSRGSNSFFLDDKKREEINNKYDYPLFASKDQSQYEAMALIANIISSSIHKNASIYLSLPYKDENGSINLAHSFIEEIFYKKTLAEFNFNNLVEYGLIYQEYYIQKMKDTTNDNDAMMSFFFYDKDEDSNDKNIILRNTYLDIKNIISSIKKRGSDILEVPKEEEALFLIKYFLDKGLSVTDILNIIICPQYFLHIKLFRDEQLKINEIGINYSDIGIIYHEVFHNFLKSIKEKFNHNIFKIKDASEYNKILTNTINNTIDEKYLLIDESKFDIQSIKEELDYKMNIFINKERQRADFENHLYIPSYFEEAFYDYSIYNNGDINIKINGRIDRIDLHYKDNSYKDIDGIRIIDYKPKVKKFPPKNNIEAINTEHPQLMFYLDYIINNKKFDFEKNNISMAYIGYNQLSEKNNDYFIEYNETEKINILLDNLRDSLNPIFDKISKGIINYHPTKDGCSICPREKICIKSYSLSEDLD